MMMIDGAKRRSIIRRVWPQLVDFLSHHSEWLLKKAEMLLSQDDLSIVGREPDLEKKRLLILDRVLRDVDANPEVFRKFIQSVCFECSLPMELEVTLMSVSQEGEGWLNHAKSCSSGDRYRRSSTYDDNGIQRFLAKQDSS